MADEVVQLPQLEVKSRSAHYAYPDLEFLRDAGRSILNGWRIREPVDGRLPPAVVTRLVNLVKRHVENVVDVSVSPHDWTVIFSTRSPRGSRFTYGFDVLD